jgi:hypothetical protein
MALKIVLKRHAPATLKIVPKAANDIGIYLGGFLLHPIRGRY